MMRLSIFISGYVVAFIILVIGVQLMKKNLVEKYVTNKTLENQVLLEQMKSSFSYPAELFIDETIGKPEILQLIRDAAPADDSTRTIIRNQLLEKLSPAYTTLQKLQYKQLQIHLPDGQNLVRFNQQDIHDDNVIDIRPMVKAVHTDKKALYGFEEGKYFIGYRYVFPLFFENEFIGSIESGISFEAIQHQIMKNSPIAIDYFIGRNSGEKYGYFFQDYYQVSEYSEGYFTEKNNNWTKTISFEAGEVTVKEVVKLLSREIEVQLNEQIEFSLAARIKDSYVIATFIPVRNFKGEIAAFCAFFQTGDEIVRMHNFFLTITIAAVVALTMIFGLFIYLFYSRQEIRLQATQLENINATKDRFFSIISHDLISPFTQLMGFMDILLRDLNSFSRDELRHYLQQIQSNTKSTYNLVQNLLSWSRLQREVLELNPTQFDFSLLIKHCISHYQLGIENKELKIAQHHQDPLMVKADEQILKTVVRNLFSNAIKFTYPNTTITLKYWLSGNHLCFSITDQGTGIPMDKQKHIFSNSTQSSMPGTRNEKGTGLGLMLCKELIELHRGRIWLESTPAKGTTVFFEIPISVEGEAREQAEAIREYS